MSFTAWKISISSCVDTVIELGFTIYICCLFSHWRGKQHFWSVWEGVMAIVTIGQLRWTMNIPRLEGVRNIFNTSYSKTTNLEFSIAVSTTNTIDKHNLTNLNYVHGYFLITYVWPHLKTTSSDLIHQQTRIPEKILGCTWKTRTMVFTRKIMIYGHNLNSNIKIESIPIMEQILVEISKCKTVFFIMGFKS